MKRKNYYSIASLACFVLLFNGFTAFAQDEAREFTIRNFKTAAGSGAFYSVEGASVPKGLSVNARLFFNYQYSPLVVRRCRTAVDNQCDDWSNQTDAVIKHRVDAELVGALGLFGIGEIGIGVPVVMYQQSTDILSDQTAGGAAISPGGLEDLRLHLKLDILNGLANKEGGKYKIGLALLPTVTFPVGSAIDNDSFMGDTSVTVHPQLATSIQFGRFRLGVNAGYFMAKTKETYLATVGSAISYGAATEIMLTEKLDVLVEAFGRQAVQKDHASAPLEVLAGIRLALPAGLSLDAGMGVGALPGLATPVFRGFTGLNFFMGKAAGQDTRAESMEESMEEALKPPDWDDDNIMDANDKCVESPEDYDGFEDDDGCPELDNDNDEVVDLNDDCPNVPEDADGFADEDGCPDPDNDNDGVLDADDQCDDENETFNGNKDADGCKDRGTTQATFTGTAILLSGNIRVNAKKGRIAGKKAKETLNVVAGLLRQNTVITAQLSVHGTKGAEKAKIIVQYLVAQGVPEARIATAAAGAEKPADSNVAIKILKSDK